MNSQTKKHLTQALAVLGVTVITGTAYFAGTSGNMFQSQLIGENQINELTLFDGNPLVVSDSTDIQTTTEGTEVVSSVFDATPSASVENIQASEERAMTGMVMNSTGMALGEAQVPTQAPLDALRSAADQEELQQLVDLRPSAMEGANPLMEMFGGNTNSAGPEAQSSVVSSAVTAADILAPFRGNDNENAQTAADMNTLDTAENEAAKAALAKAPKVPQTGAETWLLSVSILCAMMGMTMLMTSPKQL